jgi:aspartate aminotransferase
LTRRLATRLSSVQPSATLAIAQRAAELRRQGIDIVSFSLGEPDFHTPTHVRDAAKRAIDEGASHYTAVRGMPKLREAICADSKRRRGGVEHTPDEVVVSVGAKHALFNVALALYDEGDEVIIPAPYWVSYPEQARMLGATPILVETREEDGFVLSPEALERAITPRTKALILCTPSNPTGAAYSPAQLGAIAAVARKHDFWLITDEIYSRLVYGGFEQRSFLEVAPELRDRMIIVDGVSKTYAMTGWRIGWILAPKAVCEAVDLVQGQSTTNPTTVAQFAALAALEGPSEPFAEMHRIFDERRRVMVGGLSALPGLRCRMPDGAFYAFPSVLGLYGKRSRGRVLADDVDVARWMLEEARVAVVPGTPFGAPGYVRLSYATSTELIREGVRRLGEAISALE